MVSVFCDSVYTDVTSEITAYGVLTESYLSEDAKKMLLCDMAEDIGLNAYRLERRRITQNMRLCRIQCMGMFHLR